MGKIYLLFLFALTIFFNGVGQTTLTLQPGPNDGKDARINSCTQNNWGGGNGPEVMMAAWTYYSESGIDRALIYFDLSSIPVSATVTDAKLYLYGATDLPSGGHSIQSGPNNSLVQRIVTPWDEQTVNWSNQPSVVSTNQVTTNASTSSNESFTINVTNLVQDMVDDPNNSYGFSLKLVTESQYRRLNFCSSDYTTDTTKHPKLEITYTPNSINDFKTPKNLFNIYPNPSNDIINIDLINSKNASIEIFDVTGQTFISKKDINEHQSIDISNWTKGIYIVRITTDNYVQNKKIIRF